MLKAYLPVPPPDDSPLRGEFPFNAIWQHQLREAAFWSLGQIYAADMDTEVADLFVKRLRTGVDYPVVLAVSLGRMRVQKAIPILRDFYESDGHVLPTRRACAWALLQITGVALSRRRRRNRTLRKSGTQAGSWNR